MTDYTDYFTWLEDGRWIRVSARAIIFNRAADHILVEDTTAAGNPYLNFIGGAVEVGETLQACLARELSEETGARITAARYLFVLENFIPYGPHGTETRHSLEHYFKVDLDRETVTPTRDRVAFRWLPIHDLRAIDLRPSVVRDTIQDGAYARASHMIQPNHKKVEK